MVTNNRDYWRDRYLQLKAMELTNTQEYEKELFKRMNGLQNQIDKELAYWFTRYAGENQIPVEEARKIMDSIETKHWRLTLDEFKRKAINGGYERELNNEYFKSQIARLEQLENQLIDYSSKFAGKENDNFRNQLANQFHDTYMRTTFTIQQQKGKFTKDFAKFDNNQLRLAISKPWQSENFSSRIWKNYRDELPSQLMDSIMRGTITGRSYTEVSKDFKERFSDVKTKNIHRLVITEMGHTTENATAQSYQENDVEKYEYLATLETKTCLACRNLDGKVFKVSNKIEGTNYPLIHPYCRCTTVAYIPKSEQAGVRYDQEAGVNIQNMSYKQWQKKQSVQTEML